MNGGIVLGTVRKRIISLINRHQKTYNQLLIMLIITGIAFVGYGVINPDYDLVISIGAAFIISGCVGLMMMLTTSNISKALHDKLDSISVNLVKLDSISVQLLKLDSISVQLLKLDLIYAKLGKLDLIYDKLGKLDLIYDKLGKLDEIAESQKEMVSTQKETSSTLGKILTEMSATLKNIERKIT